MNKKAIMTILIVSLITFSSGFTLAKRSLIFRLSCMKNTASWITLEQLENIKFRCKNSNNYLAVEKDNEILYQMYKMELGIYE